MYNDLTAPVAQLDRAADYESAGWRFEPSQAHKIVNRFRKEDFFFMDEAIREAIKAYEEGEVPVGAVAVLNGQVIGRGHNRTEALKDPTAHAEIIAISAAANALGNWRLKDVTLYCTLEPCPMCAGAIILSRIKRLVFGLRDEKFGACGSVVDLMGEKLFNHKVEVKEGIEKEKIREMMQNFFKEKREK